MEKFKEENYKVGFFITIGRTPTGTSHVVDIMSDKPICGFKKDTTSQFIFKSFKINDVDCNNCRASVKRLKKKAWKRY